MSYNALIQLFGPTYISCYFKYDYVFALTFGIVHPSEEDLTYFLNVLCISNTTFFQYFQLVSLILNMSLCIDLILTIYSPFQQGYRRTVYYYIAGVLVPFFLLTTSIENYFKAWTGEGRECINREKDYGLTMVATYEDLVFTMVLAIYSAVAIYSLLYS